MNIDSLLHIYFHDSDPLIEVFDESNIGNVYKRIVDTLSAKPDIETGVLQALAYCFYEVLDNTLIHSGKSCGTAITSYDQYSGSIRVLVADDGQGIRKSLAENPEYAGVTDSDALLYCIKDKVSDGKGLGFGLYSTSRLISTCGISFEIWSGAKKLVSNGITKEIVNAELWQGTIVYLELDAKKDIDANAVVDNRTDCAEEFNEQFLKDEFDKLW